MALDGFKNGLFCIDKNCSNNDMLGKLTFPSWYYRGVFI